MKNKQFEIDIVEVPKIFEGLHIVEKGKEKILRGKLEIIDSTDKLWDTYNVEIMGSTNYPNAFPKLFEIDRAFPKNADWHVYEDDKSCCVDVPPNEAIICNAGLDVIDYIRQFAIPYFANQTFRKREGYYLYGEYSHGVLGRLEYYQSKLKARNMKELLQMFDLIIRGYNPDRRAFCPFCHKSKFRHCHRDSFRDLQKVKWFIARDGEVFLKNFKATPNFKLPKI